MALDLTSVYTQVLDMCSVAAQTCQPALAVSDWTEKALLSVVATV